MNVGSSVYNIVALNLFFKIDLENLFKKIFFFSPFLNRLRIFWTKFGRLPKNYIYHFKLNSFLLGNDNLAMEFIYDKYKRDINQPVILFSLGEDHLYTCFHRNSLHNQRKHWKKNSINFFTFFFLATLPKIILLQKHMATERNCFFFAVLGTSLITLSCNQYRFCVLRHWFSYFLSIFMQNGIFSLGNLVVIKKDYKGQTTSKLTINNILSIYIIQFCSFFLLMD